MFHGVGAAWVAAVNLPEFLGLGESQTRRLCKVEYEDLR